MDTEVSKIDATRIRNRPPAPSAALPAALTSAPVAGIAAAVAVLVVPAAAWLSVSGPDAVALVRWPLMGLGVVCWALASRRWAGVERALTSIIVLYVLLSLTFLFEPSV